MIASLSGPAPAMRCEVAEFDVRGLPLRLRWIPAGNFLGAKERLVLPAKQDPDRGQEAAIEQWRASAERILAHNSAYQYHYRLKRFLVWLRTQNRTLADVDRSTVERYLAELRQKEKPNTVRMSFKAIRNFYIFAQEQGAPLNPVDKIKQPRIESGVHTRDELSDLEVLALLATCKDDAYGKRDRAMICLMAYGGLRQGEVSKADLGDIETRSGRQILWVWGKGHQEKDAYIVLAPPAENAVRDWLAVRPGSPDGPMFTDLRHHWKRRRLSTSAIRGIIKNRMHRAGINNPRKTTHSLRHSAATNTIRNGATPLQAMAFLRHKDIKTTLIYYHEHDRLQRPAEDLIVYSQSGAEEQKENDQKQSNAD